LNEAYTSLLSRLRTPRKHGKLVLAPSHTRGAYDSHAVDCPFVFEHGGRFYMVHVGWDSIGYRTGLASSEDLLHWRKEGLILDRGPRGSTTEFSAALTWILRENELFAPAALKPVEGRFVGTYHAYPEAGYEVGPARIGLCRSRDLRRWELEEPFLRSSDGGEWERGGLYKSCLVEHGGTYYMFYNAKNRAEWPWVEQIGVVTSNDLESWRRYPANPVLPVGPKGRFDDTFASEPCVCKCGDVWVMFYFGLSSDGHARDSVAFSRDLIHWEESGEVLVDVGPDGAVDSIHAHKPSVITNDGRVYHYYCAVAPARGQAGDLDCREIRGIAVALA